MILLTDGSVNPQSKIGYGACLVVAEQGLSLDALRSRVQVKRFEQTSSTKLELQTLLWAMGTLPSKGGRVVVVTDSQNIMGLMGRRDRLEKNGYRSKKNKPIKNSRLYQEFYRITDQLDCEFVQVKGHKVSHQKDAMDRLFTLVDKASRNALRAESQSFLSSAVPGDVGSLSS